MGQIINAICKNCSFQKEFLFGAGMMDFTKVCKVPAVDKETGKFVVKNYLSNKKMGNIIFYNHNDMFKGTIGDDYHSWGEINIKKEFNLCPECKLFTLNFDEIALFD